MSKPEAAEEFAAACDLSPTSIEDAMERLAYGFPRPCVRGGKSIADITYFAKIALPGVMTALHVLEPHGIPLRIESGYAVDEWSLVARAFITEPEPRIVKAEIWSPGA